MYWAPLGSLWLNWILAAWPLGLHWGPLGERAIVSSQDLANKACHCVHSNIFVEIHKSYFSQNTEPELVVHLLNSGFVFHLLDTENHINDLTLFTSVIRELRVKWASNKTCQNFLLILCIHTYHHFLSDTLLFCFLSLSYVLFHLVVSIFLNNPIPFRREWSWKKERKGGRAGESKQVRKEEWKEELHPAKHLTSCFYVNLEYLRV